MAYIYLYLTILNYFNKFNIYFIIISITFIYSELNCQALTIDIHNKLYFELQLPAISPQSLGKHQMTKYKSKLTQSWQLPTESTKIL